MIIAGIGNSLLIALLSKLCQMRCLCLPCLQGTVAGAAKILERLVRSYSDSASHIIAAIAAAGPLREALLLAAEELASTLSHLESQKAPAAAVAAVAAVLGACVSAGVQQLVVHLSAVPGWLLSHESWLLSVTHSGDQPVTQMPQQLQVLWTVFTESTRPRFVHCCLCCSVSKAALLHLDAWISPAVVTSSRCHAA